MGSVFIDYPVFTAYKVNKFGNLSGKYLFFCRRTVVEGSLFTTVIQRNENAHIKIDFQLLFTEIAPFVCEAPYEICSVIASDAEGSEASLAVGSLRLRSHMVTQDNAYLAEY